MIFEIFIFASALCVLLMLYVVYQSFKNNQTAPKNSPLELLIIDLINKNEKLESRLSSMDSSIAELSFQIIRYQAQNNLSSKTNSKIYSGIVRNNEFPSQTESRSTLPEKTWGNMLKNPIFLEDSVSKYIEALANAPSNELITRMQ